jgi:UDP-2-acetamido-3-amino-2,3-dideoxy-glucuronate N-acetyltransferase
MRDRAATLAESSAAYDANGNRRLRTIGPRVTSAPSAPPDVKEPSNDAPYRLIRDVLFGENVVVYSFTNLYGCRIGDNTRVGPFVEIQAGAVVGANCKIQSHSFICSGVTIGDGVFVGHGVLFINAKYPRATNAAGTLETAGDWQLERTTVADNATLGSGVVVLGGVTIGREAMIGAGAVVTRDVPARETVAGNPSRSLGGTPSPRA